VPLASAVALLAGGSEREVNFLKGFLGLIC
jgi:hypothetical protein